MIYDLGIWVKVYKRRDVKGVGVLCLLLILPSIGEMTFDGGRRGIL
jgi:hypothetical protein